LLEVSQVCKSIKTNENCCFTRWYMYLYEKRISNIQCKQTTTL